MSVSTKRLILDSDRFSYFFFRVLFVFRSIFLTYFHCKVYNLKFMMKTETIFCLYVLRTMYLVVSLELFFSVSAEHVVSVGSLITIIIVMCTWKI